MLGMLRAFRPMGASMRRYRAARVKSKSAAALESRLYIGAGGSVKLSEVTHRGKGTKIFTTLGAAYIC